MITISTYSLRLATLILVVGASTQCKQDESPASTIKPGSTPTNAPPLDAWSIPKDEVVSVLGVDAIPALTDPELVSLDEANSFLQDDELIIGYKSGEEVRAYPHQILDWHEIINDNVDGNSVAITYCPLTGTSIGWERNIDGKTVDFGVSGLLYNSNLIPYDRTTQTRYSQMLTKGVNGELINQSVTTFQVVETTWGTWKSMFPQTTVVSLNTGFIRSYGSYPYFISGQDYRTDPFLLFPVANDDTRLPRKERVLTVFVSPRAKAFRIATFTNPGITVKEDSFNGVSLVIAGSAKDNFIVVFDRKLESGEILDFSAVQDMGPIILQDTEGNTWDLFGECIEGPRKGQFLSSPEAYVGFWFAFGAFFPDIILD